MRPGHDVVLKNCPTKTVRGFIPMEKPRRFDKAWMEALERGVGPCLRAYVRRQMGMTMRCFGLARAARALRPGALL